MVDCFTVLYSHPYVWMFPPELPEPFPQNGPYARSDRCETKVINEFLLVMKVILRLLHQIGDFGRVSGKYLALSRETKTAALWHDDSCPDLGFDAAQLLRDRGTCHVK